MIAPLHQGPGRSHQSPFHRGWRRNLVDFLGWRLGGVLRWGVALVVVVVLVARLVARNRSKNKNKNMVRLV